jgi:hypothetical protein
VGRTEKYVVGLLERILGPAERGSKRFEWARGDVSPRTRRAIRLFGSRLTPCGMAAACDR